MMARGGPFTRRRPHYAIRLECHNFIHKDHWLAVGAQLAVCKFLNWGCAQTLLARVGAKFPGQKA